MVTGKKLEAPKCKADDLNNKGVSYLDLGKEEDAVKCWRKALEEDPQHLEATYNLGYWQWHRGEIADDQYILILKELEKRHNQDSRYWHSLAHIHLERGDQNAVKKSLQKVRDLGMDAKDFPDIPSYQQKRTFEGHADYTTSVAFSQDGRYAFSFDENEALRLWDIRTGMFTVKIHNLGQFEFTDYVALSPDRRYVLSTGEKKLRVWEIETGQPICILEGHTGLVDSIDFSPDGRFALSGAGDKTVRLWDIEKRRCRHIFEGHREYVAAVAFSPDGKYALSGGGDKVLKLWDIGTGECIRTFEGHSGGICTIVFSQDSKSAFSGGFDDTVKIWNIKDGEYTHTLIGHTGTINSITVSPDGRYVLSGSEDSTLRFWDTETGQCIRTFEGHSRDIHSVAFSPDGRYALSGSDDGTIKLWELRLESQPEEHFLICHPRGTE